MADYYCTHMQELDDVHRLLPPEILRDIGIIAPAERCRLAVVDDIALRLAGVLGEAAKRAQHNPPCRHYPQARGSDGREVLAGGGNARRPAAPAPFLPAPAVPWQVMEGLRNNRVLHPAPALPRFAPASPLRGGAQPTVTRRSGGTGVFLPRTDAVRRTTKAARSPSNDVNPMRQCRAQKHRRGDEAAMVRRQQELIAMDAKMEQRQQCVDDHACPEFGLPLEWTY